MNAFLKRSEQTPRGLLALQVAGVAIAAALLHVFLLRDVWSSPHNIMPGWPGDNNVFLWNLWWISSSLRHGDLGMQCDLIHYPVGVNLAFHTNTWLYAAFTALFPVRSLPGYVFAYNLIMLLSSALSAVALFLVAKMSKASSPISAIVAVVLTFINFRRFAIMGHLNFVGTEFFLFAAYAALMAIRSEKPMIPWTLSGLMAGLAFWNDQTLGVFSLMYGTFLFVFDAYVMKRKSALRSYTAFLFVFVLSIAIYLPALARQFFAPNYYVESLHAWKANDVLNFLIPSDFNIWIGGWCYLIRSELGIQTGYEIASPGIAVNVLLAGMLIAIFYRRHRAWKHLQSVTKLHLSLIGIAVFLCLGEELIIAGYRIIPLPGLLMQYVPVLNNLRVPQRFIALAIPSFAYLVSGQVSQLVARSRIAWVVLPVLLIVAFGEMQYAPAPFNAVATGRQLQSEIESTGMSVKNDERILNFPVEYYDQWTNLFQIIHQRPIITGAVARTPKATAMTTWESWPELKRFLLRHEDMPTDDILEDELAEFLAVYHVTNIIIHDDAGKTTILSVSKESPGEILELGRKKRSYR